MFDPVLNLTSWFGILFGIVDTLFAAFLTPVFGLLGIPIPSLATLLAGAF